ncbi:MAG: hypothetical protein ABJC09_08460 [Terriglobia bacterium]
MTNRVVHIGAGRYIEQAPIQQSLQKHDARNAVKFIVAVKLDFEGH